MIRILKSVERGHADHGWLDAHHTFSFAGYMDPERMGYGALRVLNQDRIQPGAGFPPHGHEDMEIVTFVLDGVLEHKDSMGNGSRILPGEVQYMAAGSGVTHSEFNGSDEDWLELLQMWVLPAERGTTPRYGQKQFLHGDDGSQFVLAASPDGREGSLTIGQDALLHVGKDWVTLSYYEDSRTWDMDDVDPKLLGTWAGSDVMLRRGCEIRSG